MSWLLIAARPDCRSSVASPSATTGTSSHASTSLKSTSNSTSCRQWRAQSRHNEPTSDESGSMLQFAAQIANFHPFAQLAGAGHGNAIAWYDPLQDLDIATAGIAELHASRADGPFGTQHPHHLPTARLLVDGGDRHQDAVA